MEKVGIQGLKSVLDLSLALVEAGVKVGADGKISLEDIGAVVAILPAVLPVISLVGQLPAELADLSEEEAAEAVAHVMLKLAVEDAKARAVVAASLKTAAAVAGLVQAIRM